MINLHKATTKDIDLIRELAQNTWFETYKEILSPEQAEYMFKMMYSVDALKRQITEECHNFYIAYSEGTPSGFLSVVQEKDNLYHIQKIYVLPDKQKSGLGKILLEKAFEHARNTSKDKNFSVVLNVNRNNKAVSFYKKMGMYISQEGDFDIGNGYFMNDYIMRIDF